MRSFLYRIEDDPYDDRNIYDPYRMICSVGHEPIARIHQGYCQTCECYRRQRHVQQMQRQGWTFKGANTRFGKLWRMERWNNDADTTFLTTWWSYWGCCFGACILVLSRRDYAFCLSVIDSCSLLHLVPTQCMITLLPLRRTTDLHASYVHRFGVTSTIWSGNIYDLEWMNSILIPEQMFDGQPAY
jgi:hypothetical protein